MKIRPAPDAEHPVDSARPVHGSDRGHLRLWLRLRQVCVAFFKHDLSVRRAPEGVRIELLQRTPAPAGREETQARREKQELELMLLQLAELLGELPETRHTLRHIVFVEQALSRKGLRALHKLPLEVLQRALEQLEGLVTNWSPVGLAGLRSKMAVAIIDREHADPEAEADAYRTAAVLEHAIEEAPPSGLQRAQRSDDEALAAAYAALGSLAPSSQADVQGELQSASARAVTRASSRAAIGAPVVPIRLQELEL